MRYTLENGKTVTIPDKELEKFMLKLDLTKEKAIQLWLEDNDFEENEEQTALQEKASKVKIKHDAGTGKPRKKSDKPRTVNVSDAKQELFSKLSYYLNEFCKENDANYQVLNKNKLFQIEFGGEKFKLDLIQQRKPKNK